MCCPCSVSPLVKARSFMSDLVPVSLDRHGAQVWQRFRSYAFVQDQPLVPIVLGEHEQVAATLPMIAAPTSAGLWPVAVTRLGPVCALVAANGVWRGSYVPSILRVHPFAAQMVGGEASEAMLLVNEASGLIAPAPQTGEGWEPFFTDDGKLAPTLAHVVQFFADRVAAETRTRAAMTALVQAGALTPTAPFARDTAAEALPKGALYADPVALAGLSRSELAHLHRTDALALAHAMLVARHHFSFLAQAEAQLNAAPQAPRTPDPAARAPLPEDRVLAGFFDAIATAQTAEAGLPDLPDTLQRRSEDE